MHSRLQVCVCDPRFWGTGLHTISRSRHELSNKYAQKALDIPTSRAGEADTRLSILSHIWPYLPRLRCLQKEKQIAAQQKAVVSVKRARGQSPSEDAGSDPKRAKVEVPITPEDERILKAYYEQALKDVCVKLNLPSKVESTALQYMKRFYTQYSCLEHDPHRIMPTAIYVACKVEESYMSAEEFSKRSNLDVMVLLKTEVPLMQGLGFDLVVYSPYRALNGLFQELDDLRRTQSPLIDPAIIAAGPDQLSKAHQRSRGAVATILQTDAPLLFTPGLLAVAALRSGFRGVGISCPKLLMHCAKKGVHMGKEAAAAGAAAAAAGGGGGGGGVQSDGAAEQQLLQQLRQVDELVVSQTSGLEGLQAKATEVDRKIKLWQWSRRQEQGSI